MQQQDQSDKIEINANTEVISEASTPDSEVEFIPTDSADEEEIAIVDSTDEEPTTADEASTPMLAQAQQGGFDWPALIAALVVAAFFALTARFNSQPAPSFLPVAVFSATGCGLLVTAIHKLRRRSGAALLEAGLGGFGMALLQFAVAFTYPSVFSTVTTFPDYGHAFLITWGLVALFAVILSLAGATIGHLAFASLRPLPVRAQKSSTVEEDEEDEENEEESADPSLAQSIEITENVNSSAAKGEESVNEQNEDDAEESVDEQDEDEAAELVDEQDEDEDEEEIRSAAAVAQPQHSLLNYAITVLLLGLLPMMAGYVFAATYDFVMNAINVNAISPALYPTLGLLSGLLPWRLAVPINLNVSNGPFIVFTLLWRIPDEVLGNPNLFDVQVLETLVFNATGLALLLITMYGSATPGNRRQPAPWNVFLFLEALLGLILILPANLWLLRGLEGILQFHNLLAQLPTVQLLNPVLFILNLVTGVLFCLIIGLIVRRQYQLWTAPRVKKPASEEELD